MVMRYYWGLGIGHTYSHHQHLVREKAPRLDGSGADDSCSARRDSDDENSLNERDSTDAKSLRSDQSVQDLQDAECDDTDSLNSSEESAHNPSDEESLLAFEAMYGDDWECS
jgi:hypothetical protein